MIIDLFHNKLVKDTVTDAFVDSFNSLLVPMITDKYGDTVEAITMYEDYLGDDLLFEGAWHYPLSVKLKGEDAIILWVKWPVSKKTFRNNVPYAYVGKETVDFSFADYVPDEFAAKLQGRAIDYDRKAIKISVEAVTDDPMILVGKYSQTFVDELARQITKDISTTLGVDGFENTTMELQLVFAPGTYLEHTSEKVTYRRLLLVEKNCQARDFWVKWTRLDGEGALRMSDHANAQNVEFRIGEDASQKIREKEYRFLAGANPNKYQAAMGKKTVTEWRDIIKRAIKREELVKVATESELVSHANDLLNAFSAIQNAKKSNTEIEKHVPIVESTTVVKDKYDVVAALSQQLNNPITETVTDPDDTNDDIAALVRATLGNTGFVKAEEKASDFTAEVEETEEVEEITESAEELDTSDVTEDEVNDVTTEVVEPVFAPITNAADVFALVDEDDTAFGFAEADDDGEGEEFAMGEVTFEEYERTVAKANTQTTTVVDNEALIREKEAQLRLEQETEARLKAERESEMLRLEREKLIRENARLTQLAKEEEERRIREEEARKREEEERQKQLAIQKAEEERIRLELEERKRREEMERYRFAETARMAVEEQKRIEAERQAKIEREKQEALARESERLRLEEERRREEARQREEAARKLAEEERQRREAEAAKSRVLMVQKNVNLVFRNSFDPNIMHTIKQIIVDTITSLDKSDVDISIHATQGDYNLIVLQIKLPSDEIDLLVNIGKAIGNARIGVIKVSIE